MIEVYKYPNGHSSDIMNDIFKLRENLCHNSRNINTFQTEKSLFVEIRTRCYPYRVSQLWQQGPIDIREDLSQALFKNRIKTWKCEDCP